VARRAFCVKAGCCDEVADYTGSPEILDGRVKTLHPAIHGGLLSRDRQADLDQLAHLGWSRSTWPW